MILRSKKNNEMTQRERLARIEGRVSILIPLVVGNFLTVIGLALAQALG